MKFRINLRKVLQISLCLALPFAWLQIEAYGSGGKNKAVTKTRKQAVLWQAVDAASLPDAAQRAASAQKYLVYRLDSAAMRNLMAQAPLEFTAEAGAREAILEIPDPQGKMMRFRLEESPVLAPEIARQFPTWKTFSAQGIDDPTATARFDFNQNGFHGYVLGAEGTFLIDPYSLTDKRNYIVYYKGGLTENPEPFFCKVTGERSDRAEMLALTAPEVFSNGTQLRTYRIAVSATREYTNFFGSVANAFAAIQTTVNRMNGIYRRELATTFTLVSGTNTVFTDANDGGFTGGSNQGITHNQTVLDQIIGNANYDIGHVLARTPNPDGLAQSPSLCDNTDKAQGFTGAPTPQGDGFDVDYVAHEIGHQFGMSHTFNNNVDGTCNTRSAASAYEPASGVTIMGYAGICAPRNLSANSIEYFNLRSFDQSLNYLQTVVPNQYPGCGTLTATNNAPPSSVSAGGNFTIPKQTPFVLTASATDANGDALTYLWEEFDLGGATSSNGANDTDEDGTARPIFRAYNPSSSPSRTFPSLPYILNNANVPPLTYQGTLPNAPTSGSTNGYVCAPMENCTTGERLPSIARTMNFRVTVRDNRAGGGGIADAQAQITIVNTPTPFRVTSQNAATTWDGGSTQTVTWDVAGTTGSGINTANVKISLSTDGGQSFPITLLASTPNDGDAQITVPNNGTTQGRIKVEAVGNIFFDINDANLTINAAASNRRLFDFDGDGKADVSVFRPSNGTWYLLQSQAGFTGVQFGISTDVIAPADFDGDGKTDVAVFRSGNWFLLRSQAGFTGVQFGAAGDIPQPADFDGDGKAELAVYRPSAGAWFVLNLVNNAFTATQFGVATDKPVVGDYDGDGKADPAVFRPSDGAWYLLRSQAGFTGVQFGIASDIPVPADFDGDGKTDPAVYRSGSWFLLQSQAGFTGFQFGITTDVPAPADYDGDGKADAAVFRDGAWYLLRSQAGFTGVQFGVTNDQPVPNAFVP